MDSREFRKDRVEQCGVALNANQGAMHNLSKKKIVSS